MKDFLDELDMELGNSTSSNKGETKKTEAKNIEPKKTHSNQTKPDFKKSVFKKPENNNSKSKPQHKPRTNSNKNYKSKNNNGEIRGRFPSKFPDTKFYLPSLRKGYTRFIPVGGNNETGSKNMGMFQYEDDIILIDCGIQFSDATTPGVNYLVPDVSFLTKYKDNIKGIILTHGHLDHIGTLKHVLPALGMPTLYGTKLTLGLAKKGLEEAKLMDYATFVEIDAGSEKKIQIGQFKVEFFKVNHSIPDCAGVYIESPGGAKFMHTGDFKIDHTPEIDDPANLDRIEQIGKRGITMFLSDSTGSTRKGFCKSEKEIGETLDEIVRKHTKGRLIIAAFSSWISRVQQLINSCERYDKTIFLSGRSMIENVNIAKKLGYLKMKQGTVRKMTPKNTEGILPHNQVIITTGSQGEQFSALVRMAEGKHNAIEIVKGDTIIFSSSVVPGNTRSVVGIINKLIQLGGNVITKDDGEVHTGGHAFQEEQKIMLNLVKPRYFMPVYGDLYFRTVHKRTAVSTGFKAENVLLLNNGNIVDFAPNGNVFRSKIRVPVQQIVVDGHGMGVLNKHVIEARDKMMNSGVLVIGYKVDKKTKAIMGHIKLETRGLVYIEEVRYIHRMIIKKAREIFENTIKDVPDMEEKDLLKIIRTDLESFLTKRIDRTPMIIPTITEV